MFITGSVFFGYIMAQVCTYLLRFQFLIYLLRTSTLQSIKARSWISSCLHVHTHLQILHDDRATYLSPPPPLQLNLDLPGFLWQLNDILQSLNREEKEIERHMEGYIAFMRHCKYALPCPVLLPESAPLIPAFKKPDVPFSLATTLSKAIFCSLSDPCH